MLKSIKEIFRSYAVLDSQGRHVNGTDKESNHHYGDAYESLFPITNDHDLHSAREDVRLMMEVGIADGSSLLAWRDVFPNALCVGMDIHIASKIEEMYAGHVGKGPLGGPARVEFCQGDQRSLDDCLRAAGGRQFDFIVEDATHELENTLLTFFYLWPFVKPGGMYVVEEFANIGSLRPMVGAMWPCASIVDTTGPSGGCEPLVVFRKRLSWYYIGTLPHSAV